MSQQNRRSASVDMTTGKSLPLILKFSLPILLGNIFQQLYTVVDGIVVGKNVSAQALAAVGVGFPITYMLTSIFLGLGLGASVLVSQHFGNRDMDNVHRVVTTMNAFLLIIAVPLTLFGILTTGPFLRLLGTDLEIFADAKLYMSIYYIGLLPQFGYNVNASIMQGIGDSKTPLYILISSSVLHVALAALLVVVFPLGVAGVAWSTVLSQLFSWVLSIILINRKYPEIKINLLAARLHRDAFKGIIKVGLPIGLQNALYSVGMMVMQPLINGCGWIFTAGYNAAVKVDGFVFIPVTSLATAITTFVGQNIGAGKQERIKEGIRATMLLAMSLCLLMCAVVIPFRSQLMGMFVDQSAGAASEVIAAGNAYLLRVIPLYFIYTLQYMYMGIIRGAGRTLIPTVATLAGLLLGRVPSAYLLTHFLGPDNMHWCYAIGWALGLVILIPYYYRGKWKKGAVIPGKEATP